MGGAIVISLLNSYDNLPIDGSILVAPAIWNFKERNFLKVLHLPFYQKYFLILVLVGKGLSIFKLVTT